jgi:hypothetical protein
MIIIIGERVGADVHLVNIHFTVFDPGISVFQIGLAQPEGLYFGTFEYQAGFQFIFDEIVIAGLAVLGDDFDMFLVQKLVP